MKKTHEPLLDDLLAETAPPEFRATLLAQTVQTARRRKRRRRFSQTLGIVCVVAIAAFVFRELRPLNSGPQPIRQPSWQVVDSSSAIPVRVVGTEPGLGASLTIAQTTDADRPKTINDRQLFAMLADQPVVLICPDSRQAQMMVLNTDNGKMLPVR